MRLKGANMIKLETAMPFFNNNNHFIIFIPHFAQHTQHPTHDIATVVGVVSPTLFHPFFPLIYKNKQMQNSKVKINKKVFFSIYLWNVVLFGMRHYIGQDSMSFITVSMLAYMLFWFDITRNIFLFMFLQQGAEGQGERRWIGTPECK